MKKRYGILVVILIATAFLIYYFEYYLPYPVYNGEELLNTEVYSFTFVFFGDNRPATIEELKENVGLKDTGQPEVFVKIVQMINEEDPLFVVGGGDYVLVGTDENFEEFLNVVSALNAPLFYVCGNHDHPGYEEFLEEKAHALATEKTYAITYRNTLFVVLDNSLDNSFTFHEKQLDFLEKQLKKGFEHTFVFLHVPPFGLGKNFCIKHPIHCMADPDEFLEIVLKYKVDYVFCSHIHSFYQEKRENTMFIISGGAGAPLIDGGFYHYIVIEVGDDITYTVVKCEA